MFFPELFLMTTLALGIGNPALTPREPVILHNDIFFYKNDVIVEPFMLMFPTQVRIGLITKDFPPFVFSVIVYELYRENKKEKRFFPFSWEIGVLGNNSNLILPAEKAIIPPESVLNFLKAHHIHEKVNPLQEPFTVRVVQFVVSGTNIFRIGVPPSNPRSDGTAIIYFEPTPYPIEEFPLQIQDIH